MFVVVAVGGGVAGALPPGLLEVLEPGVELVEGFAADVVDASATVGLIWAGFDEACFAQLAEVFADRRLGLVDSVGEVGDRAGLVGELPDDRLPDRVCEQLERAGSGRRE